MTALPDHMTVVAIREPGGPDVLTAERRPLPKPGAGEILIKVAAAGVNRPDVMQRMGLYPPPPGATEIPGLEIAGEVVERGADVTRWNIGDLVMALVIGGGYAEYCLAHESHALPVPSGLSLTEAAAIPETYFTVWYNLFERARGGRNRAHSRRLVRDRHDCHSARQGVWRPCRHDRRFAGEMRSVHQARRRRRH